MDEILQKIINALSELRFSSMQSDENTILDLMHRYNLLFLGSKFNTIYSDELALSLKTFFDIDINIDELNKLIPIACDSLKMKFKPIKSKSGLIYYSIALW